jgi:hypothetical protein
MMTDPSINYQVDPRSIDFAPDKRLEIIYAQGKVGGAVRGTRAGLAPFKHQIVVKGTSMANALSNARTILQAIINEGGGYLEYKPTGLAAGVMSTYYHYLKSKPPKLLGSGALTDAVMTGRYVKDENSTATHFVKYSVELSTKAWATSDPDTRITIVSQTTLANHDDAGHNNFVIVDNDDIKGDAFLPIISIARAGSPIEWNYIFVHKRRMRTADNDNLDWFEGESGTSIDWSTTPSATYSNGDAEFTNVASPSDLIFGGVFNAGMDSTYIGKVTPIARMWCTPTAVYDVKFKIGSLGSGGSFVNVLETNTIRVTASLDDSPVLYTFTELDFPPTAWQDIDDDDLDDYLGNVGILVEASLVSGAGNLLLDYFVLAKADEFIAVLFGDQPLNVANMELEVDSVSRGSFLIEGTPVALENSWAKRGSPYDNMIMLKGFDYRWRFIGWYIATGASAYNIDDPFNLTIEGLHATIYPFEEV